MTADESPKTTGEEMQGSELQDGEVEDVSGGIGYDVGTDIAICEMPEC